MRCSIEMLAALAGPLGLRVEMDLVPARRGVVTQRTNGDVVHAAMGELEASHLRSLGYGVAIDDPYQHFQFAGRADVLAWSREPAALLHFENRTRFPNIQEAAGSWNAKRAYLAPVIAERLGVRRFRSVTHVMACLWSAEVLHAVRIRAATFQSLCPDPSDAFDEWWRGTTTAAGTSTTLILLDPFASGRQKRWIDLEVALSSARPRISGYADAAERIDRASRQAMQQR
jgi:hypothetical protein